MRFKFLNYFYFTNIVLLILQPILPTFNVALAADPTPLIEFMAGSAQGSEATTNVTIPVVLNRTPLSDVTVSYSVTGGFARSESNIALEKELKIQRTQSNQLVSYTIPAGSGQDFILNTSSIQFKAGEGATKYIDIAIINDQLNETDETIELTLYNPVNAIVGSNQKFIYQINDDDRSNLVSVTETRFAGGAKGDGVSDDRKAIEAASDFVHANGGGVVFFPSGTYLAIEVHLHPGVTYEGYGAIIKRPNISYLNTLYENFNYTGVWNCNEGIEFTPHTMKVFTTHDAPMCQKTVAYRGQTDSEPLIIKGLTFDGNLANQGTYRDNSLEHAADLFLTGGAETPGRLKAFIEDVTFNTSVGDGLWVLHNVDAVVYNVSAINCWRSGIASTEGHSIVKVRNFTTKGNIEATGIDVEDDGNGYGGSKKIEMVLVNVSLEGKFDIDFQDGSILMGQNIQADSPFYLRAIDSNIDIADSVFKIASLESTPTNMNRIVLPGQTTFTNTDFISTRAGLTDTSTSALQAMPNIEWYMSGVQLNHQTITLDNCRLKPGPDTRETDIVHGIRLGDDVASWDDKLIISNSQIGDGINTGISTINSTANYGGGNWNISKTLFASDKAFEIKTTKGTTSINMNFDSVIFTGNTYMTLENVNGSDVTNVLNQTNIIINDNANHINAPGGLDGNIYHGNRVILGESAPTANTNCFVENNESGLQGDTYFLKVPVSGQTHRWTCANYNNDATHWTASPVLNVIASLNNLPSQNTNTDSINVSVSGKNHLNQSVVRFYKYKIDQNDYSPYQAVETPINVHNLNRGYHSLSVIGFSDQSGVNGTFQPADQATLYSWFVDKDTSAPMALIAPQSGNIINSDLNLANLNIRVHDNLPIERMKISSSKDFNLATEEAFASTKTVNLTPSEGYKTFYAWFKDSAGNWSTQGQPISTTLVIEKLAQINLTCSKTVVAQNTYDCSFTIINNTGAQILELNPSVMLPEGTSYVASNNFGTPGWNKIVWPAIYNFNNGQTVNYTYRLRKN